MDTVDASLLNVIQTAFPIAAQPYLVLGNLVGIDEEEAFARIERLRREGIIRRLGGIFNSRALGYYSTLCAAKVPEDKVGLLTEVLAGHPGVTHNYLRNHAYNMWFTLISPSQEEGENTLDLIRRKLAIPHIYSLPALRLFKIKVEFNFGGETDERLEANGNSEQTGLETGPLKLTERDKALVRRLQEDLPHTKTPFADIGAPIGMSTADVLAKTKTMIEHGAIRRFGTVLRHQKAGFTANAMGVWQVPADRVEETGKLMAEFTQVSHCYERPALPDWPYNLFTMIHGRSTDECRQVMSRIADKTGIRDYSMLFSIKELKKCSMRYFEESNWTL